MRSSSRFCSNGTRPAIYPPTLSIYLPQVLLALLTPDPSHARGLVHARVRRRLAASLRELCDSRLARTRLRL